jgi:hypothetical protein
MIRPWDRPWEDQVEEFRRDPRKLGLQFLDLLEQIWTEGCPDAELRDAGKGSPLPGQPDLFLALDHEGVAIAVVGDEREFGFVRFVRLVEVLFREMPASLLPETQIALADRRLREIAPRFQMIRL